MTGKIFDNSLTNKSWKIKLTILLKSIILAILSAYTVTKFSSTQFISSIPLEHKEEGSGQCSELSCEVGFGYG